VDGVAVLVGKPGQKRMRRGRRMEVNKLKEVEHDGKEGADSAHEKNKEGMQVAAMTEDRHTRVNRTMS
jgi:hypothetical protein